MRRIGRGTLVLFVVLSLVALVMGLSLLIGEAVYGGPGQIRPQADWEGAGRLGVGETIKVYAKFDLTLITLDSTIKLEVVYPDHSPRWAPWHFELPLGGGEIEWEDPYGITYKASIGAPDGRGVITVSAPEVVVERFLGKLTRNPAVQEDSAAYLPYEVELGVGFFPNPQTGQVGFYAGRVGSDEGGYHLIGPVVKLVGDVPYQSHQRLVFTLTDEIRQELGFQPWGGETTYVVTFYEVWSPPLIEPMVKPPPGLVT